VLLYQAYIFTQVLWLRWHDPQSTAFMQREGQRLARETPPQIIRHTWVPYDQISRSVKQAVISSEDSGFMAHQGVQWDAIRNAMRVNRETGEIRFGGSTITMQLAKNLFLSSDRSYVRKAQELVIAKMLEAVMDKERILELYLNTAEWGVGVFGIEAAAEHYFKRSAAGLTPRQVAWLAAILPSPKRYDRNRNSRWIERKTGIILRRMPMVSIP
jgi:monofunctional glycosyltransferase